jgi:D-glycero-D-manno-heptose 1,7-bisphosphate phosphatase
MVRPALFLDRDGVINVDHGYVHRKDNFEFIDGIFELVAKANSAGYLVVVITNQAGIGRGYYTETEFHQLMYWVCNEFKRHGGQIDAVYFCPYHPEYGVGSYRRESEYRKPGSGMLYQAARDLNIDLTNSIMVGDTLSDMEAAHAAGVQTLLYLTHSDWVMLGHPIGHLSQALLFLLSDAETS